MKKSLIALALTVASLGVNAQLIQHTDQIAEVKFTGSSYELGLHVGEVAKDQILDSVERFNDTLGIMLPGLNVASLGKSFEGANVFEKLKSTSPDAAQYIQGLSESLNLPPSFLLAVGMSDEAILESQRNGGMGFLQAEAPAKCSVMGQTDGKGKAWGAANFDYMGVNYEGLIVLNHTDEAGKTRIIQTWAGLIPYGGITKGGQPLLMNTMADEGTARQKAGGEILAETSTPSYHLSWDAYNAESAKDLKDMYKDGEYTAYFSYVMLDANDKATHIENGYPDVVRIHEGKEFAHTNHSNYQQLPFVDEGFGAHSLSRLKAAQDFLSKADINTSEQQAIEELHTKPLWKGRGELMGTVTSTYFSVNGKKVDMAIYTDKEHKPVHIRNY